MFDPKVKIDKMLIFTFFLLISACSDRSLPSQEVNRSNSGIVKNNVANECSQFELSSGRRYYNKTILLNALASCYDFLINGQLDDKDIELDVKQYNLGDVLQLILAGFDYSLAYVSSAQGESVLRKIHIADSFNFSQTDQRNGALTSKDIDSTVTNVNGQNAVAPDSKSTENARTNQAIDYEYISSFNDEWDIKLTSEEQDAFLIDIDIDTETAIWLNEKISDTNVSTEDKIVILQRVEIEDNFAAKSVGLNALKLEDSAVVSMALDMLYSWGDNSVVSHINAVASKHPDNEIRKQAKDLYDYFLEEF